MHQGNPDEEIEKLKTFWNEYGNSLVAGVIIGLAALFGFKYWQKTTAEKAIAASNLYTELMGAVAQNQVGPAREYAGKLIADYQKSPYAGKAALVLARMDFDAGDRGSAENNLRLAMEQAREDGVRHAARLRLARILADRGDLDGAMKLAEQKDTGGFAAEYAELRGDILLAKGDRDAARAAYQEAVRETRPQSPYLPYLTIKLDDLGGSAAK
jgi:predicted negative regulator of RcsB-dependent stress response